MKSSEGSRGTCKDTSVACQFMDKFLENVPMHNLKLDKTSQNLTSNWHTGRDRHAAFCTPVKMWKLVLCPLMGFLAIIHLSC